MTDIDVLARLLFTARRRSRRLAKRLIREAGGKGTAGELDAVLAAIYDHPARERIEHLAAELAEAHAAAESTPDPEIAQGADHDDWLVAEGVASGRTYLVYLGPDAAMVGEVFDAIADAPPGFEAAALDDGQVLSNVLWLCGEPPPRRERLDLYERAREALRAYDARIDPME